MFTLAIILASLLLGLYFAAHYNFWRPKVSQDYPRVLMYHSINPDAGNTPRELVVSPHRFDRQLRYLCDKDYTFVTVSELIQRSDTANCVALTFDDGFADNYLHAFPLLKKYGAKATIYLATEIEDIERLTKSMISEMQHSGLIEFGAHTVSHCNLSKVDEKSAKKEIESSKKAVEALSGAECKAFAYPFGRFNETSIELVREAGFTSAVTVKKGIAKLGDRFRIQRISVLGSTNLLQFHIAISRGRYRV